MKKTNKKKFDYINNLNKLTSVDMTSSGYIERLFSVFNNNDSFCFKESKISEGIIFLKKKTVLIHDLKHFSILI